MAFSGEENKIVFDSSAVDGCGISKDEKDCDDTPTLIICKKTTHEPIPPSNKTLEDFKPDSESYYPMNNFPRGCLLIFNVEEFESQEIAKRDRTNDDADKLCQLFPKLGFLVRRFDNPSGDNIIEALKFMVEEKETYSCYACFFLSHGDRDTLEATDRGVLIRDIVKPLQKERVAGKPKLMFFQTCRGFKLMETLSSIDSRPAPSKPTAINLPDAADFLYAHSTVDHYYSFRGWFVSALDDVFTQYAHKMDIVRLLTRVNDAVTQRRFRVDKDASHEKKKTFNGRQNISSFTSCLRKEFYFFPPNGPL